MIIAVQVLFPEYNKIKEKTWLATLHPGFFQLRNNVKCMNSVKWPALQVPRSYRKSNLLLVFLAMHLASPQRYPLIPCPETENT